MNCFLRLCLCPCNGKGKQAFKHNDDNHKAMCYVKIDVENGFFYQDGTGYKVDYVNRTAETFPFVFDIVLP
ncbi:hypothetical protein [Lacrimispora saccharolytica]|uniref:Uncharacterized protein n=1 Tax=Lacrimispora saccharolytica (strain ATCC 35040 / DSM 2544 / NRCC 2533 / WM1) TaxID=610130 RepID=D9R3M6_LACSW|nr:hypothetical protein [Lacrimispora saccharolytica]ADL06747.1 hypothetical protein Closa_4246 [[Clostridium] saccharolyticum WM1]QRV19187.1 hypothetical protein I6K70_17240 [Lacrimispora saccharolytica]